MRRIYLVDLGLLVAAGTLAIVLTAKPVSSEPASNGEETEITAVSYANAAIAAAEELFAEWVSYEEDDPGSH